MGEERRDGLVEIWQRPALQRSGLIQCSRLALQQGIHTIVATQTPRADVVTGVIKANISSRIAFQVNSGLDSRIILDAKGAERLLGHGDMLYQPPGTSRVTRAQGSEAEELSEKDEDLVQKCIEIMKQERKASTSLFQRCLRLGYTRSARVVDILEKRGYVAAGEGAKDACCSVRRA